jgi:hypothetical protein
MDRASEKASAGALLGLAVLAMGLVLPHSASRASTPADGLSLLAPGMGCGPAETLVGAGAGALLTRVRADASGNPARRRDAARARPAGPQGARKAVRPPAVARSARKAPQPAEEPRAAVLRSFYTCNAAAMPNLAEGTGWRLVGPLRQS